MVAARPGGVKATGQFWKGQDQIWLPYELALEEVLSHELLYSGL